MSPSLTPIFQLWVERLNGVPNAVTASGPARGVISDYQRFRRLTKILQYAQDHEMASIRSELRDTPLRELTRGLFEVHACKGHKPPPTAYVAIKNRGYWYYIDDRDQASKSTLALVLQLSRLDFGTQKATGPILTLPVGR
jgi:hypothetical protein